MSHAVARQADRSEAPAGGRGLGLSLLVVASAQLMLVLDDTVANIALPSIQRELAVSAAALPWIISAYVLAFGSLLLLGGRAGDLYGRRRVLRIGLVVFTLASLLGGLGPNAALLIAARALQGVGAALVALVAAVVLVVAFLWQQARRADPMLPLALFRDRNRAGAYGSVLLIGGGLMATYFLLTQFMQEVLEFSPIRTGLASLPVAVGIVLSAGISSKLVERVPPRAVAAPGLLIAAAGLYWLSLLAPGASYAGHVLPALFLTYFGLGLGFMPMTLTAVHGVAAEQSGVASAILNTAQQIGAALGVAVLSTVATTASDGRLFQATRALQQALTAGDTGAVAAARDALTHGYTSGFLAGAALLTLAALIVAVAVTTRRTQTTAAH